METFDLLTASLLIAIMLESPGGDSLGKWTSQEYTMEVQDPQNRAKID